MQPTSTLARRLWEAVEPLHAVVYFDEGPIRAARDLGLRGFWMGYFACRVAPLGPVPAASVEAMAYGFAPEVVARAIPDAWRFVAPERIVAARVGAAAASLRAHLASTSTSEWGELSTLLARAAAGCRFEGRPLAASWSRVARPDDPIAATWLSATVLREHRGDGHVLAAVAGGLRGLDATLTLVATGAITRELIQPSRGWSDAEWERSRRRLEARGVLNRDGHLTRSGGALRRTLEELTDRLASGPVERLGEHGVERAIALAAPLSRRLIDDGVIPVPNPIGVPRP